MSDVLSNTLDRKGALQFHCDTSEKDGRHKVSEWSHLVLMVFSALRALNEVADGAEAVFDDASPLFDGHLQTRPLGSGSKPAQMTFPFSICQDALPAFAITLKCSLLKLCFESVEVFKISSCYRDVVAMGKEYDGARICRPNELQKQLNDVVAGLERLLRNTSRQPPPRTYLFLLRKLPPSSCLSFSFPFFSFFVFAV